MIKYFSTVAILLFSIQSHAWQRVTSTSQLNDPNYIYQIQIEWSPSVYLDWNVNMYEPSNGSNITMWKADSNDHDQIFRIVNNHIQRNIPNNWKYYCLNAYSPHQGSNVDSWECSASDSDQSWSFTIVAGEYVLIEANNSGYCLNAHAPYYNSNVNLYSCNAHDSEQLFSIFRTWSN